MTVDRVTAYCAIQADRLLVFCEASQEVIRTASGRALPAELAAALGELDQLGAEFAVGAFTFQLHPDGEITRRDPVPPGVPQ